MRLVLLAIALVGVAEAGCVHRRRGHAAAAKPAAGAAPVSAATPTEAPSASPRAAAAAPAEPPSGSEPKRALLPFPTLPRDAKGQDLIHVRIYPHLKGDPWNGGKERLDQVSVVGACKAYRGVKGVVAKADGKVLETKTRFDLTVAGLREPLWIECGEPATVDRGPGVTAWRYAGSFYAHAVGAVVELVNAVPMETYLRGVLPSEVIPSWPAETLKAQAVASRTYAYYNVAHNKYYPARTPRVFDVDDTPFFQVYTGLTNAVAPTDEALIATARMALSHSSRVVLAFFSTDAGGFTEGSMEVFSLDAPYLKPKKEAHDPAGTKTEWTKTATAADVAKKLGLAAGRKVKGVTIDAAQKTASGRARAVGVVLDDGTTKTVDVATFKKAVAARSSLFTVTVLANGDLKVDGKGAGHGVGMGQKGAKELAKQKSWDFKQILAFYYEGTSLCGVGGATGGAPKCGESAKLSSLDFERIERGIGVRR